MSSPLAEQLRALEGLQEIDIKIDRLFKGKASFPTLLKSLDDQLALSRKAIAAKKLNLEDIEKVQRQTKAAQELNQDRLTRSQSRIEGVQNSHEYQAVSKEVEQLKKLAVTLDEQLKKSGVEQETIKKDASDLEAKLEKLQADRDHQAQQLQGDSGKIDSEISELKRARTPFTSKVDPRTLSTYDRVRGARAGLGIAPALAGRCVACNMMVPPQMFNELTKGLQLHQCPSCHRILFFKTPSTAAISSGGVS